MKIKHFLFFLSCISIVFSSCEKDDDYMDEFVGTYKCDMVGYMMYTDWYMMEPYDHSNLAVSVRKAESNTLIIDVLGTELYATVNKTGQLTIPSESFSDTQVDPDSGDELTLDITISYSGTITGRTLYLKESYSGTAKLTSPGEQLTSGIMGNYVCNGTK